MSIVPYLYTPLIVKLSREVRVLGKEAATKNILETKV